MFTSLNDMYVVSIYLRAEMTVSWLHSMGKENPKRQRGVKSKFYLFKIDQGVRTGTIWYSFFLQSS